MESSTSVLWTGPFPVEGVSDNFSVSPCFIEIHVFNANSVDHDQMPHAAASDQDQHCLAISI